MNRDTINAAIAEAERFIRLAQIAKDDFSTVHGGLVSGTRASGACKRASMDLTRALADLRRAS